MRKKRQSKTTIQKMQVSQAKYMRARDFIQQHKKLFKLGSDISSDLICESFNIEPPVVVMDASRTVANVLSFNRKRLEVVNTINRVLAQRGLYMRLCKGTYNIKDSKEHMQRKVGAFVRDAQKKQWRSAELQRGIDRFDCKYKRVTNPEIKRIVAGIVSNAYPWDADDGASTTPQP